MALDGTQKDLVKVSGKVKRVVDIWRKGDVFPANVLDLLESTCFNGDLPGSAGKISCADSGSDAVEIGVKRKDYNHDIKEVEIGVKRKDYNHDIKEAKIVTDVAHQSSNVHQANDKYQGDSTNASNDYYKYKQASNDQDFAHQKDQHASQSSKDHGANQHASKKRVDIQQPPKDHSKYQHVSKDSSRDQNYSNDRGNDRRISKDRASDEKRSIDRRDGAYSSTDYDHGYVKDSGSNSRSSNDNYSRSEYRRDDYVSDRRDDKYDSRDRRNDTYSNDRGNEKYAKFDEVEPRFAQKPLEIPGVNPTFVVNSGPVPTTKLYSNIESPSLASQELLNTLLIPAPNASISNVPTNGSGFGFAGLLSSVMSRQKSVPESPLGQSGVPLVETAGPTMDQLNTLLNIGESETGLVRDPLQFDYDDE